VLTAAAAVTYTTYSCFIYLSTYYFLSFLFQKPFVQRAREAGRLLLIREIYKDPWLAMNDHLDSFILQTVVRIHMFEFDIVTHSNQRTVANLLSRNGIEPTKERILKFLDNICIN
jgi:hypothetical protein